MESNVWIKSLKLGDRIMVTSFGKPGYETIVIATDDYIGAGGLTYSRETSKCVLIPGVWKGHE